MKRKYIFSVLLLSLALTACRNGNSNNPTGETNVESENVETVDETSQNSEGSSEEEIDPEYQAFLDSAKFDAPENFEEITIFDNEFALAKIIDVKAEDSRYLLNIHMENKTKDKDFYFNNMYTSVNGHDKLFQGTFSFDVE